MSDERVIPSVSADKAAEVFLALFDAHREAANNANTYRQQAAVLVVSAFAPVAGSLIALVAVSKNPKDGTVDIGNAAWWAIASGLAFFAYVAFAVARWTIMMGQRHVNHRTAMRAMLDAVVSTAWQIDPLRRPKTPHGEAGEDWFVLSRRAHESTQGTLGRVLEIGAALAIADAVLGYWWLH